MKSFLLYICVFLLSLSINLFSKTAQELASILASSKFNIQYYFFPNADNKYFLIANSSQGARIWHFTSDRKWQPVHNAAAFAGFDGAGKIFQNVSFANGKVNIGDVTDLSSSEFADSLKNSTFNATHYFWTISKIDDTGKKNYYSFLASKNKDGSASIYHLASGAKWQPVHNAAAFDGYEKAGNVLSGATLDLSANSIETKEVIKAGAPATSGKEDDKKRTSLRTLTGHDGYVWSVDISNDKRYIFSGSKDNTIKIWDFYRGDELKTIKGHNDYIYSIDLSNDGNYLASGGKDKSVKIWNVTHKQDKVDMKLLHTLDGDYTVNSVAITNDNKYVISGSSDGMIRKHQITTGEQIYAFKGHALSVRSVAITSDDKYIVSGGDDDTVKVWDIETKKLVRTLKGHKKGVVSVAVSGDNKYIVSGAGDFYIKIWDMQTGKLINTLKKHENLVKSVKVSKNSKYIVSGGMDNTVRIWDINTGDLIDTMRGHDSIVNTVAISSDNKNIVSGGQDDKIKIWQLKTQ